MSRAPHRQSRSRPAWTSTGSRRCGRRFPRHGAAAHDGGAARRPRSRARSRRRRRDLRLRRRRHLQRGAERHRGRRPARLHPGGGTSVLPRALGLPRNPVRPLSESRQGTTRRIGARARERPPLRLRAGLGFDAELVRRSTSSADDPTADVRATSRSCWSRRARSGRAARRFEPSARDRRSTGGRRSCSSRTARRTPTRVAWRSTSFRARASTAGSPTSRPIEPARARSSAASWFAAYGAFGLKDGKALAAARSRPHRRRAATARCRSRWTARTRETSASRVRGRARRRHRPRLTRTCAAAMSSVLPAEGGLRRVIGDGEPFPTARSTVSSHDELLALYRNLVLLRTYDERSVIYHRQGRIGTYAIFWNHEAMQAGSVFALEERDWIFPSYRESAIGLLRGMPVSTVLSWWRGHPAGWWNPEELQRRVDLRADRDARPARGRLRVGLAAEGRGPRRDRVLRRRRDVGGGLPRGRDVRGGHEGSGDPLLQQQPVGDLDAALRADRRADARRQGDRLRDARRSGRRRRRARRVRGDARGRRARASRRGPDVHRGRDLPGGAACDRGRSVDLHRRRARRGGARERVRRALRALPPPDRRPLRRRMRRRSRRRRSSSCAPGSPPPRRSRRPTRLSSSSTPTPTRRASQAHDLAELRRILGG